MILLLTYLASAAVWSSTDQRIGTLDELRMLLGSFGMVFIYVGALWLT